MSMAQISCESAEHYTPATYVEAARYVLGEIDLDPASCTLANLCVQAKRFYSVAEDGLQSPWRGRVFINPPGDRSGNLVRAFWSRANDHVHYGGPGAAVLWVGFTFNQFDTLQTCPPMSSGWSPRPPQAWPRVEKRGRIAWLSPTATIDLEGIAKEFGRLVVQIGEIRPITLLVLKHWSAATVASQLVGALSRAGFETSVTNHPRQHCDPLIKVRFKVAPDIPIALAEKNTPGIRCRVGRNKQPTQGNWFCLLGADKAMRWRFRERFRQFGEYSSGRPWHPPRQLGDEILSIIRTRRPRTMTAVVRAVGARRHTVLKALRDLIESNAVIHKNGEFMVPEPWEL